jgi:hypothetical protein
LTDTASNGPTVLERQWLPIVALLLGILIGASAVFFGTGNGPSSEMRVTGTVGIISSSRTGFSFTTDDGRHIGFGMAPDAVELVKPGAHITLLVVEGDGYQVVAAASPS